MEIIYKETIGEKIIEAISNAKKEEKAIISIVLTPDEWMQFYTEIVNSIKAMAAMRLGFGEKSYIFYGVEIIRG